jgi:hypothetical protein
MNTNLLEEELIQVRPNWILGENRIDINKWSRVHPRFQNHDGCIVDLGCLGWNKPFEDIGSDNWAGYFFDKKRVIGVDPQETSNPKAELFRGFVSNFSGKGSLISNGIGASLSKSVTGNFDVLNWDDFKKKFNIKSISILKINIEGSEWDLIDSFEPDDFSGIDQICISFHDWLPEFSNSAPRTEVCVKKIISNGYSMVDLGMYGWKLFLKSTHPSSYPEYFLKHSFQSLDIVSSSITKLAVNASSNPSQIPRIYRLLDQVIELIKDCEKSLKK